MIKETIVQFVCFVTNLERDEFAPEWERYAKRLKSKKCELTLHQQVAETKNRYRYISKHEWPDKDFHFSFMNEKKSEHFPEHIVKVVQAGGYIPLHPQMNHLSDDSDVKLIAFVSHNENDIEFYRNLSPYRHLDIHQAYYESSTYGYVLEYTVPESGVDELLGQLKQRPGVETGVYKECLVPHV
jgi:hypothetical protein